jgi:hypothetical protein
LDRAIDLDGIAVVGCLLVSASVLNHKIRFAHVGRVAYQIVICLAFTVSRRIVISPREFHGFLFDLEFVRGSWSRGRVLDQVRRRNCTHQRRQGFVFDLSRALRKSVVRRQLRRRRSAAYDKEIVWFREVRTDDCV